MPDPTVQFYNPNDALLADLGLSDWEIQSDSRANPSDRLQGLAKNGDEKASSLVNKRETFSLALKCFAAAGNLPLPVLGTVTSTGHHLDDMALALVPTDWPALTVNIHKHDNGTSHTAASCRTYTPSLEILAGRGIPRAVAAATSAAHLGGFTLAASDTAIGVSSFNYKASVNHQDETGNFGNWLAGENRDGVETVEIGLTGKGATIAAPAGWDRKDSGDARGNTAAETETAGFEHHILADAPAEPEE